MRKFRGESEIKAVDQLEAYFQDFVFELIKDGKFEIKELTINQ
jgi:hypothetical protein